MHAPRVIGVVADEAGGEPPVRRGVRRVEPGQRRLGIEQRAEIAPRLQRETGERYGGMPGKARLAHYAAVGGAEGDRGRGVGADGSAVAYALQQRRLETEYAEQ